MEEFTFNPLDSWPTVERRAPQESVPAADLLDVKAVVAEAHQEGYEEGKRLAREEVTSALAALQTATLEIESRISQRMEEFELQVVELAVALAEKIIRGALDLEPERVVAIVRDALMATGEREGVVVHLNPADIELVQAAETAEGPMSSLTLQSDQRVTRGGALIQTPFGHLDAQVESKLERARELFHLA